MFKLFKKKTENEPPRTAKQKVGKQGEDIAAEFLVRNGYKILERNWRCGKNEIDIIAEKQSSVSFVEVKTTASDSAESFKLPSEAVDKEKRANMIECAREYYLHRRRTIFDLNEEYRFDVIEVYLNRETPEVNFIENAFYKEKGYRRHG